MLDSETKARIDSARDILVGKVPDPKSQVEQITIALIYKFMDDMDRQSEELGGKSSFFKGEFKKYRWADLLDKRIGGHERLLRYAEGIERMNENKNIPQLFRDIFKGVFLPYRDPETLNLFLKEINGFTYEHSERLGDAYEYLLSVLGTQGDAGQFRTPRHIIDFIVAVVDPQKNETVLDPACGTAGFLISAYKHILGISDFRFLIADLKKGDSEHEPSIQNPKSKIKIELTPDERARLMTNFCGYDIAPDMVRLSRVNLYLHGFPKPVIHEYDALTSEERWDERYDVIMANPPFMTPKGGIRPHNRFSIKANRSEVLFVDYIAEHLNPGGRAGVIVPEGIIFQSQNAYKSLRKMLVENYLWAVVSLPAGVFNPYSGVKTSILFLDRNLAKRTDAVLFVKVENDGFDLGAQRRKIDGDELPEALKAIVAWKQSQKAPKEEIAHAVSRKRILEAPDISLSGDRYREVAALHSQWPIVKVSDVCKQILSGGTPSTKIAKYWDGDIPWITSADIQGMNEVTPRKRITREAIEHSATNLIPADNIIVVTRVGLGKVLLNPFDLCISQDSQGLVVDRNRVRPAYLAYVLSQEVLRFKENSRGSTIQGVVKSQLAEIKIPLPPLVEQERLVAELEGYRRVIESARQILAHYKPTLRLDAKWPTAELGSIADFKNGINYSKENKGTGIKVIGVSNFKDNLIAPTTGLDEINPKGIVSKDNLLQDGNILFVRSNGNKELVGRNLLVQTNNERLTHSAFTIRLRFSGKNILPKFYALLFKNPIYRTQLMGRGANINNLSQDILREMIVPLPPISEQRALVVESESECALVEANRELMARFERKLQSKLAEIWGEEPAGRKTAQGAQKESA